MTQARQSKSWWELKDYLHARLVNVIDLRRAASISEPQLLHREVRLVIERLVDTENPLLNRMERERLIEEILDDAFGFGPLEMLFHDERVREIRVEGPRRVLARRNDSLEMTDTAFRNLERLYLVCGRLLSAAQGKPLEPPANTTVEMEVPSGFLMKAQFPATRLESPILHFRRLREPAPPKMVVPSLPPREQSLVIRLVKALYDAGLGDLGRLHLAVVRPFAERVVDEACENEAIALQDRAAIIDTILKEALRGSID